MLSFIYNIINFNTYIYITFKYFTHRVVKLLLKINSPFIVFFTFYTNYLKFISVFMKR